MLRYPCLVLDHDDTVVQSAETVNFPNFLSVLQELRPGRTFSLEEYMLYSAEPGFHAMCQEIIGFSEEEMEYMFSSWKAYVQTHIPPCYAGFSQIIRRQKEEGGIICVSSHSSNMNITRDYQKNFGIVPDLIFGWEMEEKRKPDPYTLHEIMRVYGLQPSELVMIDDLKPGYVMAKSAGVPFIAAGWSHTVPELAAMMRKNCDYYIETVAELENFLFL